MAAAGDECAWRVLINAYSARVFGLIRVQCNNADLAEEITQSTFCTVVAKIGFYTELGKFEQWLFRIAMNRLRDEMRRRKRQAKPVEDETLTGLAGAADDERASGRRLRQPAGSAARPCATSPDQAAGWSRRI
jgi:RNA polymerase sigma-70 factor (ECF subfamily)